MNVVARATLLAFVAKHSDADASIRHVYATLRGAKWRTSADVRETFPSASIVTAERVVLNIARNKYRLVIAIDYRRQHVWVKWIGTHAAYDGIDVRTVEHEP